MLVFGSKGFLGTALTRRARKAGVIVEEVSSSLGNGLDPETGLLSPTFKVPSGTEVVVYLSQSPRSGSGLTGALHTISVNTHTVVAVALAAAAAGASRFIYTSSGTVYGPSFQPLSESSALRRDSWYTLSKVHAEEALGMLCRELDVTVVRPFAIYGPSQTGRLIPNLVETIGQGGTVTVKPRSTEGCSSSEDGGLRISLCHVEDAADTLLHFAFVGGPPCVNIASSEALSIREIAQSVARALGKTPVFSLEEQPRSFDLVACTELLSSSCPVVFRTFEDGLASVIARSNCLSKS